jgi:hypothetical protein
MCTKNGEKERSCQHLVTWANLVIDDPKLDLATKAKTYIYIYGRTNKSGMAKLIYLPS